MPQEKESDILQAEGVRCVASGKELYQAFLKRGLVPSEDYYFDVHNPDLQYYMRYSTFTMVYKTNILQVNDTVNMTYTQPEPPSERCCNVSMTTVSFYKQGGTLFIESFLLHFCTCWPYHG